MAIIQPGALTGDMHGRLGQLVIRHTRFGLVVQTKAPAKTWTTPAAMTTKANFRLAQRFWGLLDEPTKLAFKAQLRAAGKGIPGPWNGSIIRAMQGNRWYFPYVDDPSTTITFVSAVNQAPWWRLTYTPVLPFLWRFWWFAYFDPAGPARVYPGWNFAAQTGGVLLVPQVDWTLDTRIFVIPMAAATPLLYGIGDAIHPPSP